MTNYVKNEIKNTKQVLHKLKISNKTLSKSQKKSLNKKGFIIIRSSKYMRQNLKKLNDVAKKLIKTEGDRGGWEGKEKHYKKGKSFEMGTNRLGNLINKHKVFRDLILIPEILAGSYEVIKSDMKIAGLNLRNPLKNCGNQRIHIDWKSREKETDPFYGVVCFVFLDKANLKNGALRIIPGSHKKLGWPDKHININKPHKNEIRLLVPAGTIVIANLNIWHAGANNLSGSPRKMIMINIKRRDQPQLINYKKYLSKKTKKSMNEIHNYLLAIRNCDLTQREDSVGVGKFYRQKYKNNWKNKR